MDRKMWIDELKNELQTNILPFWSNNGFDQNTGRIIGLVKNDRSFDPQAPLSAVLVSRLLWTYSAAYRMLKEEIYLEKANQIYAFLMDSFWDQAYSGVFWLISPAGQIMDDRKQIYAQSFFLYAISEYYQITKNLRALRIAKIVFAVLEKKAHDKERLGYPEGFQRDWSPMADARLSEKEPFCHKSMNTILHTLEGFTNLYKIWPDEGLAKRLRELITLFFEKIIDPESFHFHLFFEQDWKNITNGISYGHDIEGSWLLTEAAEVLGDAALLESVSLLAVKMADVVLKESLLPDGSLIYERHANGQVDLHKHWWVMAEAMVGFMNAFQISGEQRFKMASRENWLYIQKNIVDQVHGDWYKLLDENDRVLDSVPKIGPWQCPYHHSRACMEMIQRLTEGQLSQ